MLSSSASTSIFARWLVACRIAINNLTITSIPIANIRSMCEAYEPTRSMKFNVFMQITTMWSSFTRLFRPIQKKTSVSRTKQTFPVDFVVVSSLTIPTAPCALFSTGKFWNLNLFVALVWFLVNNRFSAAPQIKSTTNNIQMVLCQPSCCCWWGWTSPSRYNGVCWTLLSLLLVEMSLPNKLGRIIITTTTYQSIFV